MNYIHVKVSMAGDPVLRSDRHTLGGVIKVNGVPARKRLVIVHKETYEVVASTWSNETTGEWQVTNINEYPERSLFVVAFDDTGEFNAEIADFVSQVAPT